MIYLSAVVMVLVYFIIKTLFLEEKEFELKSFDTKNEEPKSLEAIKPERKSQFLLLPPKD